MDKHAAYRSELKKFSINLSLRTEGVSYFIIIPLMIFYVWSNLNLTKPQMDIFIKSAIFGVIVNAIITNINNMIIISPIVKYFKKLVRDEEISDELYTLAQKRFLSLPYLHAIFSFFRWISGFSLVIIPTMMFADLNSTQIFNMWVVACFVSPFATIMYFLLTELYIQKLIELNVFPIWKDIKLGFRMNLFIKYTSLNIMITMVPFLILIAFFLIFIAQFDIDKTEIFLKLIIMGIIGLVVAFVMSAVLSKTIIFKVKIILDMLRKVGRGEMDIPMHKIGVEDELVIINNSVFTMKENLRVMMEKNNDLNRNLEKMVMERTEELRAAIEELQALNEAVIEARDELWGEMQLAKKIQMVLLPEQPVIRGFEISAYMAPADDVGGDFYDVINVGGYDWIVIGDVSGHGVPAGLIMMMVQTAIHTALQNNPNVAPSKLLELVNHVLSTNIRKLNEDKYVTITVFATHAQGEFCFSGLHQDILIYRAGSKKLEAVESNGMWIGVVEDMKGMVEDAKIALKPGDVMLLYTDGITEAWNRNSTDEMFGEKKLIEILQKMGDHSSEDIKNKVLEELKDYTTSDDFTIFIMKHQ